MIACAMILNACTACHDVSATLLCGILRTSLMALQCTMATVTACNARTSIASGQGRLDAASSCLLQLQHASLLLPQACMHGCAEAVGDSVEAALTLALSEANEVVQSFAHVATAADGITQAQLPMHMRLEQEHKLLQACELHTCNGTHGEMYGYGCVSCPCWHTPAAIL